jgi:hypothetical protein
MWPQNRLWFFPGASTLGPTGEMAEWLKAHAWKACIRETVSWVRIPLSPPCFQRISVRCNQFRNQLSCLLRANPTTFE